MAVKKLKFAQEDLPDIQLVGIHTSLRDYRLAYFINKETGLRFERHDDLPVYDERNKLVKDYSFFSYYDPDKRTSYYLFSNDHETGKMIDQYSQANFFLMISENRSNDDLKAIQSKLRKITTVNFVFEADINKIKDIEGILHDLELHLINRLVKIRQA
ncbi:MAG: IPExxxVDY family protein [Chloroflexota bacterium]